MNQTKLTIRVIRNWTVPIYEMLRGSTPKEPQFTSEPVRVEKRSQVLFSGGENAFEIWKQTQSHWLDQDGVEVERKTVRH